MIKKENLFDLFKISNKCNKIYSKQPNILKKKTYPDFDLVLYDPARGSRYFDRIFKDFLCHSNSNTDAVSIIF